MVMAALCFIMGWIKLAPPQLSLKIINGIYDKTEISCCFITKPHFFIPSSLISYGQEQIIESNVNAKYDIEGG